jgi:hypothetical protein
MLDRLTASDGVSIAHGTRVTFTDHLLGLFDQSLDCLAGDVLCALIELPEYLLQSLDLADGFLTMRRERVFECERLRVGGPLDRRPLYLTGVETP